MGLGEQSGLPAGKAAKRRLPPSRRWDLTGRLLRRALAHRRLILLGLCTMVLSAAATVSPIWLARVFVAEVLGVAGTTPPADSAGSVISDLGRGAAGLVGMDIAAGDGRTAALAFVVIAILLVTLVAAVTQFFNEFFAKYLAARIVADLRQELMAKVLQLPLGWFTRTRQGDLQSRFATDAQVTYRTINTFLSEFALQPLVLSFALVSIFLLNWKLAACSLVLVPLVIVPVRRIGNRVHRRSRRSLDTLGETMEAVNQVLLGQRVVKAFSMEETERRHFAGINEKWIRRQASLLRAKALNRGLMNVLDGVTISLALAVGGWMVIHREWGLTADDLTAFLVATGYLFRPMRRISVAYNTWQESLSAADRLFEVLDHDDAPGDPADARAIGPIREGIAFEDVTFAYTDGDGPPVAVLRGVSFLVPAGTTVALVGPSGAGKSTIADLVFRFFEPTSGRILVDGVPLGKIRRESLLRQVAVVGQQPFLFNTSVRQNIAYGRPGASQEEIEAAARAACIHDDIVALPGGYDAPVGDRGAALSGGQLQRITIARAILKDASLLLDEATSNLDAASENAVQEALANLLLGRTALVIAHRLSTIVDADRILVIEAGRIVEEGKHADLLANGGAYHRLYAAQLPT